MATNKQWPTEALDLTKRLWTEGYSASQIATELSRQLRFHKTRNAVIGQVHRHHMPARKTQTFTRPPRPPRRTREQKAAFQPRHAFRDDYTPPAMPDELRRIKAMPALDASIGVGRLNAFTCKFPIGDPKQDGFAFCGRTVANEDHPYCGDHCKLAYRPIDPKNAARERRMAKWVHRVDSAGAAR
jgi:GcrA cell cycle regulator